MTNMTRSGHRRGLWCFYPRSTSLQPAPVAFIRAVFWAASVGHHQYETTAFLRAVSGSKMAATTEQTENRSGGAAPLGNDGGLGTGKAPGHTGGTMQEGPPPQTATTKEKLAATVRPASGSSKVLQEVATNADMVAEETDVSTEDADLNLLADGDFGAVDESGKSFLKTRPPAPTREAGSSTTGSQLGTPSVGRERGDLRRKNIISLGEAEPPGPVPAEAPIGERLSQEQIRHRMKAQCNN
ncbi:unnamed protein product [Amoebophrya sp. A120]|nr:unnamed protein product [Amoebophrya sp. A120]|eukprot:GSA120T00023725001.1